MARFRKEQNKFQKKAPFYSTDKKERRNDDELKINACNKKIKKSSIISTFFVYSVHLL